MQPNHNFSGYIPGHTPSTSASGSQGSANPVQLPPVHVGSGQFGGQPVRMQTLQNLPSQFTAPAQAHYAQMQGADSNYPVRVQNVPPHATPFVPGYVLGPRRAGSAFTELRPVASASALQGIPPHTNAGVSRPSALGAANRNRNMQSSAPRRVRGNGAPVPSGMNPIFHGLVVSTRYRRLQPQADNPHHRQLPPLTDIRGTVSLAFDKSRVEVSVAAEDALPLKQFRGWLPGDLRREASLQQSAPQGGPVDDFVTRDTYRYADALRYFAAYLVRFHDETLVDYRQPHTLDGNELDKLENFRHRQDFPEHPRMSIRSALIHWNSWNQAGRPNPAGIQS